MSIPPNVLTPPPHHVHQVWKWIAGSLFALLIAGTSFTAGYRAQGERVRLVEKQIADLHLTVSVLGTSHRLSLEREQRDRTELLDALSTMNARLDLMNERMNRR